jgi:copper chaperone CopZ
MNPTLTFYVANMTCQSCKNKIETVLKPIDGIESMDISVDDQKVIISYPMHVNREHITQQVIQAIESKHYQVTHTE